MDHLSQSISTLSPGRTAAGQQGFPWTVPAAAGRMAPPGNPHRVTRLKGPYASLLHRINQLGVVTILTANPSAIQEKTGVYEHAAYEGTGTLTDNAAIHQHVFYQKWKYGFAREDTDASGQIQRSLHFFDTEGHNVHKILLHEPGRHAAFQLLVDEFAAPEQNSAPASLPPSLTPPLPDLPLPPHIDVDALRADWAYPEDKQAFFERQSEFDRQRLLKLRMAGKAFAHQVSNDSVRVLLQKMADVGTAVMTQVGNVGIVQAYQGRIKQIRSIDSWLNILNPGYRLRLREDRIDSVWVTKKPTTEGFVTSLELFDRQGRNIARFFSKPEAGKPEPREWRESIMRLMPVFGT